MGLRIQNNVEAFNTHRQLSATSASASKAMEKLSSGYRINRAADDAAGLAISEKMRGQIGGLAQSQRNAQDGISLVQTAEGAFGEVHSMLQRVRDLTVQYKNGTLSQDDKDAIIGEVAQLAQEIREIGDKTAFNGKDLLKGATFSFQVGANDGETVTATGGTLTTTGGVATVLLVGYADAAAVAAGTPMTTAPTWPPCVRRWTRSPRRRSTRRSRTCRRSARTSARSRTASSTVWRTWRPTRRTWWRRSRGSVTWTWPLR